MNIRIKTRENLWNTDIFQTKQRYHSISFWVIVNRENPYFEKITLIVNTNPYANPYDSLPSKNVLD